MPQIELVPIPLYQPTQPYHHLVDNIPINALIDRILLVNSAVDVNSVILTDAIGTQGTLSNRLIQSINPDGSLKTSAVDAAQHNIAEHTDGSILVDDIPISYVRMLLDERAKLELIAPGATSLNVLVTLNNNVPSNLPSQISVINISEIEYDNETLHLKPSDSVYWSVETDGSIKANTNFPATVRHLHNYDLVPEPENILSPDYTNYIVTSTSTPYRSGSLRVYINGIRLTKLSNITPGGAPRANYVPVDFGVDPTWLTYTYEEDEDNLVDGVITSGKFSLSSAITTNDVITVDFDMLYE